MSTGPHVVTRVVARDLDPRDVFAALLRDDATAFWLDSGGAGRWSILGSAAGVRSHVVTYRRGDDAVVLTDPEGRVQRVPGDLFAHLRRALARPVEAPAPLADGTPLAGGFALGYVGYLGYELYAGTLDLPVRPSAGPNAPPDARPDAPPDAPPDAHLVLAERALAVDRATGEVHALALVDDADPELTTASRGWLDDLPTLLAAVRPGEVEPVPDVVHEHVAHPFAQRHDRAAYLDLVARCQEHIRRGDSYELCLTNTFAAPGPVDPWRTYLRLRAISPVPYGAYLACGEVHVLSASPERFLSVTAAGEVETRPIKGTRPRGRTPDEDAALRAELAASEKDRAENLMIVDLLRNDLSRVCEVGSVETSGLFAVETFPLVHQLVSTVRGRLRPALTAVDAVVAAFPGGSMTGAPKRRSVELLAQLEAGPRGVYSGALGWFSLSGAADLSIVIRTIVTGPAGATFGVGGAITALSDPAEEYDETLVKARAMALALADAPLR